MFSLIHRYLHIFIGFLKKIHLEGLFTEGRGDENFETPALGDNEKLHTRKLCKVYADKNRASGPLSSIEQVQESDLFKPYRAESKKLYALCSPLHLFSATSKRA
jgi:hypothetical protein